MIMVEELKIEISSEELDRIITEYVSNKMEEAGYALKYTRCEDGFYPDTFWRGAKIEGQ